MADVLYGMIDASGQLMSGSGFSVRKLREGLYVIEFAQPFSGPPAPVCTVYGPEWKTFNISVALLEVTNDHVIYATSNPERPLDAAVSIIVAGPRG